MQQKHTEALNFESKKSQKSKKKLYKNITQHLWANLKKNEACKLLVKNKKQNEFFGPTGKSEKKNVSKLIFFDIARK